MNDNIVKVDFPPSNYLHIFGYYNIGYKLLKGEYMCMEDI